MGASPLQLDRTHVAIRVRTLSEIGDLAIVMIRRYPSAIFVGFTLGALPWIIANTLLLAWIPIQEREYGLFDEAAREEILRYASWMALLVVAQAPAAGVLTTIYLGQAVFEKRPPWRFVINKARRLAVKWIYVLGIKRLAIPIMVFVALRYGVPASAGIDILVPVIVVIVIALVRGSRPFLPEILLLEECPLRDSDPRVITASRRAKSLHAPMSSELSGRFLSVSCLALFLFLSVLYTFIFARGILLSDWNWGMFTLLVLYPAALWFVAGITVLIRFLNYLDTRIRLEGWEVELAVRAEAIRQFGEEIGIQDNPGVAARNKKRKRGKKKANADTESDEATQLAGVKS